MLPILIAIAVILLLGIVIAFVSSNREDDQVLGTAPTSMPSTSMPAPMPAPPSDSFATPVRHSSPSAFEGFNQQRLQVGATVSSTRGSGKITAVIRLSEDGSVWSEYLVADPTNGAWWLVVENEGGLSLMAYTPVALTERPGPNKLNYQGSSFSKIEGGTATYTSSGDADLNPSGRCDYMDYRGSGGQVLAFERFDGGEWEASIGEPLSANNVSVS